MKRWIQRLLAALSGLAALVSQAAPASAGWENHNETLVSDQDRG